MTTTAAPHADRTHPITAALHRAGRQLSKPQLHRAVDADFPDEEQFHFALQAHIRAGDVVPTAPNPEATYALIDWCEPAPPDLTELERVQRITRLHWTGQPA